MTTQKEINRRQNLFLQKAINERLDPPKIIHVGSLFKKGESSAVVSAEVIETLTYPDPNANEETEPDLYYGHDYYTLRLLTDATAAYAAETEYLIGNQVIASNNLKYTSLTGTVESPNVGNEPSASPTQWEKSEEIRVSLAIGCENIEDFDIRNCVPWVEVGEIVELTAKLVDSVNVYYLKNPTLIYTGTQEQATLRYNPTLKITQAVFL